MTTVAGDKVGPYELLGRIGQGGMGEVFRARDGSRCGHQVLRRALQPAIRAGGACDCGAEPSSDLPSLRRRAQLPGDGTRRRPDAGLAPDEWTACAR